MVNKKRYICFSLIVAMLIASVVPIHTFASDTKIIFSEGFNTLPTNSAPPSSVSVVGGSESKVVNTENNNKALRLGMSKTSGSVAFPASSGSKIWLGARLKINGKIDNGAFFQIISSTGSKLNLINLSGFNASFYDGKHFALLKKGVWTNIHVMFDIANKNYSVWVDGKKILSNWKITGTIPALSKVGFEFSNLSSEASVEFDHLIAYSGSQILKELPEEEYNSQIMEDTQAQSAIKVPKLYIHEDFNTFGRVNATYTTTVPLGNPIEVRNQQGHTEYHEGDRMYLHMANENGQSPYYDLVLKKFNSTSYIVDMVVNVFELNVCGMAIQLSSRGSSFYNLVLAETNGVLRSGGDVLNNLDFNRWTRLSFAIDHTTSSYDIYIDGVLVKSGLAFSTVPQNIDRIRISLQGSGYGAIGLDAIAVYEGRELKPSLDQDDYMENVVNGFEDDDNSVNSFIGDKAVFCVTNSAFYKDGVRKNFDQKGFITSESVVMSPIEAMASSYGLQVTEDTASGKITLSNGAVFTIGDEYASYNGQNIYLGAGVVHKDGIVYVPAIAFFESILGKKTTYESTWELIFLTEDGSLVNITDASMMRLVMHQMIFDRISGEEMSEKVTVSFPDNEHPRLGITKTDIERIKTNIESDEYAAKLYNYLKMVCDDYLRSAPLKYVTNKSGEIDNARTREERMANLGVMYHITGDAKYADKAIAELEAMLQMPYLGWGNPLTSGALMAAFTRGYDLFYDYMSEDMRAQIKDRVLQMWKRELLEGADATGSRSNQWRRTIKDNFVPVHNAPYLESTLAFVDEADMAEYAKQLFVVTERALEYTSEGFAPDGAWDEGIGYWIYTLLEWAPAVMAMKNTLGTTLGFEDHLGMNTAAYFRMDAGGLVRVNNYNDAGNGAKFSSRPSIVEQTQGMFVLADLYDDATILKGWLNNIDNFNLSDPGYSLAWYNPELLENEASLMQLDRRYRSRLDYVSLRSSWEDDNAILLGANSGMNNFGHSHIDGGTYVIDAMGLNWVCELGTESYSASYDPTEGKYYRTRPEAHNVYLINPRVGYQGQDINATGSTIRFESMERSGYAVVDMSNYYAADAATAQRGFKLAGDRSYVVVRDEIALLGQSDIISFITTQADIEILDNNRAYFKQFGKKMLIEVTTNGKNLSLESMACDMLPTSGVNPSDAMDNSEFRKLAIRVSGNGSIYINVKLTPLYEDLLSTSADDIQLALWENEEGEICKPRINSVSVNGEKISLFNPKNSLIKVELPEGTTKVPAITAIADDNYTVEIRQSSDNLFEDGIIKLTDKTNPENVSYYVIRYVLTPEKVNDINSVELLPVTSIIAEESGENVTASLTDRNLATGKYESNWGHEYLIDLGSIKDIDSVITGFSYISDLTKYWYDVAYSVDGQNFTYKTGQTSLGSDGYERLYVGENVKARYIRLILNGRTASKEWQLNEVAVVGK